MTPQKPTGQTPILGRFFREERGATAIEYAFLAAMIAVVIAAIVALMGGSLTARFQAVRDSFP